MMDRREIRIRDMPWLTDPTDTGDVDAHVIWAYFCDNRSPHAIFRHPKNTHQAIEEPDSRGSVEPIVVEGQAESGSRMVPAADDDEYRQDDVEDEKELVCQATEVEVAQDQHSASENCGDDPPSPVRLYGFLCVAACTFVCR